MTGAKLARVDWSLEAVQSYDACPAGRQCPHCAAGLPAAPDEAGDPRDVDSIGPEVDQALRFALPPAFHLPRYMDLTTPKVWICAVCWDDDGNLSQWPCHVAEAHGNYVHRAMYLPRTV